MTTKAGIRSLLGKQSQIFVTETCNYGCDGCPYPRLPKERKAALRRQEISPSQWKTISDYLYIQGIRLFCLIGGEPCYYEGIAEVISNITNYYHEAFVLLSTSGLHLRNDPKLKKGVAEALIRPHDRKFKNGIAISFDALPSGKKPKNSREHKAREGVLLIEDLQTEYGDHICYTANVMVCPENLNDVLAMQLYLQDRGIYTNLCTQQTKCFGEEPVFSQNDFSRLEELARKMVARKLKGELVVNSVDYLSQLPGVIGREDYKCWKEKNGSPVIDIGPNGRARFCNWIGQDSLDGPPGIDIGQLMLGEVSWQEFFCQSKAMTSQLCGGCSWSRRDRNTEPMVNTNPSSLELQNIWTQAQLLWRS